MKTLVFAALILASPILARAEVPREVTLRLLEADQVFGPIISNAEELLAQRGFGEPTIKNGIFYEDNRVNLDYRRDVPSPDPERFPQTEEVFRIAVSFSRSPKDNKIESVQLIALGIDSKIPMRLPGNR